MEVEHKHAIDEIVYHWTTKVKVKSQGKIFGPNSIPEYLVEPVDFETSRGWNVLETALTEHPTTDTYDYNAYYDYYDYVCEPMPKCECGVDTVGSGKHSTWCPKEKT